MKKELLIKAKAMASSKKVLMFSRIGAIALVSLVTILSYTGTAFAADLDSVATPIVDLLTRLTGDLTAAVTLVKEVHDVYIELLLFEKSRSSLIVGLELRRRTARTELFVILAELLVQEQCDACSQAVKRTAPHIHLVLCIMNTYTHIIYSFLL